MKEEYIIFDIEGPLVAPGFSPKEDAGFKCIELIETQQLIIDPSMTNEEAIYHYISKEEIYKRVVDTKEEAFESLNKGERNKALLEWQVLLHTKHPITQIMKTWMLGAIYKGDIKIESYAGIETIPQLKKEDFTLETLSGSPIFLQEVMLEKISLYSYFKDHLHSGKKMAQETYTKVFENKNILAYISDSPEENDLAKKAGAQKIFLTTTAEMEQPTIDNAKRKGHYVVDSIEEVVYKILK